MQNYLNEFCYKFNRRYFGENLFDRLQSVIDTTIKISNNVVKALHLIATFGTE